MAVAKTVYCNLVSHNINPKECVPTKNQLCQNCANKGQSTQKKVASKFRNISSMFGDADKFFDYALLYLSFCEADNLNAAETAAMKELEGYFATTAKNIIEDFQSRCDLGDPELVPIIVEAFGEFAFDQEWFTQGLKVLHQKGIKFKIPGASPGRWVDYTKNFIWGRELEAKAKKIPIRDLLKSNPTRYYKEKSKTDAIYIHYAFGCSRPELRSQVIEAIRETRGPEFLDQIRKIFNDTLP
jgi:hypothetical protein